MTRHYDRPIQVVCRPDDEGDAGDAGDGVGAPARLVWRETTYRVRTVLARWHLRARWWVAGPAGAGDGDGDGESAGAEGDATGATGDAPATDRYYFRLRCVPEMICVAYYDAAAGAWHLEAVYD